MPDQEGGEQNQLKVHGVRPPEALQIDENLPENWRLFKQKWSFYCKLEHLEKQTEDFRVALFLHSLGNDALRIYNSFHFTTVENDRKITEIIEKFDTVAIGKINIAYERFLFNKRDQQSGESFEAYLADLRSLLKTCEFCGNCVDSVLRDRLVVGIASKETQRALLRETDLQLQKAIDICRAAEQADAQQSSLTNNHRSQGAESSIEQVRKDFKKQKPKSCFNCGGTYTPQHVCPAKGAECAACHKIGHFAKCCRSKRKSGNSKKQVAEVEDPGDEMFVIDAVDAQGQSTPWMTELEIDGFPVLFKLDSGADVSVLTEVTYRQMTNPPSLKKTDIHLRGVDGRLVCLGVMSAAVWRKGRKYVMKLFVVQGARNNLLSRKACEVMGLVHLALEEAAIVADKVYGEIGLMKISPVKITVRQDAQPYCVQTPRRIPIPLAGKVKGELERMERAGVIRKVTEATPWCAPIVPVMKSNGKVRICVDLKKLNTHVVRERFMLPTFEDLVPTLKDSKVFSTLDASSGFWAIPLAKESQLLTTFITPYGRFCFERLPFGITSAPEVFQRTVQDLLKNLSGVAVYMDDIIVHGKTVTEHNQRLERVLRVIHDSGLKLNPSKCRLRKETVEFLGHRVTAGGVTPSPTKVQAIMNLKAPNNVNELRSALGMFNYLAKFCPDMSSVMKPLYDLLRADRIWNWDSAQQIAFEKAKQLVSSAPVLAFYDAEKPTVVAADASSYGLGAVICQKQQDGQLKPIAFASRLLTDAERRYAQIEKECLASVWACEKFAHFLVGLPEFSLLTDHKPLVPILMTKDIDQVPLRCQRLIIRMMRFNPKAEHVPGKSLVIADYLSRHPVSHCIEERKQCEEVKAYVSAVVADVFSSQRLTEIKEASAGDKEMQAVMWWVTHGWPRRIPEHLQKFHEFRHRLTVINGLLLMDNRVFVPATMRPFILRRLHDGHPGITKSRMRAKASVFWPGINAAIQTFTKSCEHCQKHLQKPNREPLLTTPLPKRPWQRIAADFCEVRGKNYLIVVDYYSRYIEVARMEKTTSAATINVLKSIYARHGIPEVLVSDNGPQFSSQEFRDFNLAVDTEHVTSSPLYAQSNGEAESAVKVAKSLLCQEDPALALLTYRSTPLPFLGYSPCQLLMGRQIRSTLPTLPQNLLPEWPQDAVVRRRDEERKEKTRNYYNKRHGATNLPENRPGQRVYIPDREESGVIIAPLEEREISSD